MAGHTCSIRPKTQMNSMISEFHIASFAAPDNQDRDT